MPNKTTDQAALDRVLDLGARSLDPDAYDALTVLVADLKNAVARRTYDEDDGSHGG